VPRQLLLIVAANQTPVLLALAALCRRGRRLLLRPAPGPWSKPTSATRRAAELRLVYRRSGRRIVGIGLAASIVACTATRRLLLAASLASCGDRQRPAASTGRATAAGAA